jgi:GNAT superfamily N-acetyltransferase
LDRILFSVIPARVADAEEIAEVLRRSIRELCGADHCNDPHELELWLANKTADMVSSWIEGPNHIVCAVQDEAGTSRILGVGMTSETGEIQLNYVHPDARYSGVSKAVMRALEAYLRGLGQPRAYLTSTRTAEEFYRSIGYVDYGEPRNHRGMPVSSLVKVLLPE